MNLSRRQFIAATACAVPLALAPRLGQAADPWRRTLVQIELNGGNDGLNTVIPFADPLYREMRPKLAIARDKTIQLDERLGLHPKLAPLAPLWRDGHMAIALGVGYPQPNLSHFRSINIWETASNSARTFEDGWIARLFAENRPSRALPADGIVLGRNQPGPLSGEAARVIALKTLKALKPHGAEAAPASAMALNPGLAHVVETQTQMELTERRLVERNLQSLNFAEPFPGHAFGQQMETAARLIVGGSGVPVIKCSLSGFDTHSNQPGRHAKLLGELAEGIAAFAQAIKAAGAWNRVLVMTYAEFGRRPRENASGGTDHGTAAPHFLIGGRVRGGFHGEQPPLDRLAGKNLAHRIDFHEIYAAVARNWWGLKGDFLNARPLPVLI
jgi:uncharacterized protein (DUF1501 family)